MRVQLWVRFAAISWLCVEAVWAGALRASVVEEHSGRAVVAAELRIARKGVSELIADVESDGEGKFVPVELEDGEYLLTVSKANYVETSLRLRAESSREPIAIRLVRCGTVAGRVTDANGAPVANAYVLALGGSRRLDTQTGTNGEYRIAGLLPGGYTIAVAYGQPTLAVGTTGNAPKLGAAGSGVMFYPEKVNVVSGDEHEHIDFSLTTTSVFAVKGSVDAPETQDGQYWVALAAVENPEIATSVTIGGTDQSFHFEGIRPGAYNVLVSGPTKSRSGYGAHLGEQRMFGRSRIEVAAQNIEDLRLKVAPALLLPVQVRAEEGCPAKVRISVTALEDWGAFLDQTQDVGEDGKVVLKGMAPARYRVRAESDTCYQAKEVTADLNGGSAGTVQVRLMRGASLKVEVKPGMPLELFGGGKTRTEMPDAEGKAEFSDLPPGHYRLKGLAEGQKNVTELDLEAGGTRKVVLNWRKEEKR